eukprot:s8327_g4.t1
MDRPEQSGLLEIRIVLTARKKVPKSQPSMFCNSTSCNSRSQTCTLYHRILHAQSRTWKGVHFDCTVTSRLWLPSPVTPGRSELDASGTMPIAHLNYPAQAVER